MAEMSESSPDISNIMNDSTLSSTSANEFDLSISDQGEAERELENSSLKLVAVNLDQRAPLVPVYYVGNFL